MAEDTSKLTSDDLTVLGEALDSWIVKDAAGSIMSELIVGLVARDGQEAAAQKLEEQKQRLAIEKQQRKDRAILLQAKLIQMRDRLLAESLVPPAGQ